MSDQQPNQSQPQYGETPSNAGPTYQAPGAPQQPVQQYVSPAFQQYPANGQQIQNPSTNAFAIVALVTSIVGISIAGVIFGHLSLSQIKKTGEKGYGMALAGLIIGYVGVGIGVLFVIFYILLIMGTIGTGIATTQM